MDSYAIFAEGMVRSFGSVRAVDGIDLAVFKKEVYGFLGPNGAGKTTMVRMLTTLLLPSAGRAVVAGYDVRTQPRQVRLRIGAALQEAALDQKQTGRELLQLQGRLYGLAGKTLNRRIAELEALVDIGSAMDRLIGTYSGGMKRRLDLAAGLVHNPEILFLDEPTTGLDPISRSRVWEEVRRINQELGVTIFLLTQYLEEADALAHRVGIINQGKLVAEDTPAQLKRSIGNDLVIVHFEGSADTARAAVSTVPGVDGVQVHDTELTVAVPNGAAMLSSIALALNRRDLQVRELTMRTPTLDDVFLHFTGGRLQQQASEEETSQ